MYFAGEALNESDLILQGTPASERDQLVVPFSEGTGPDGQMGLVGEFVLTLRSIR
jgi:hypothetical protein